MVLVEGLEGLEKRGLGICCDIVVCAGAVGIDVVNGLRRLALYQ